MPGIAQERLEGMIRDGPRLLTVDIRGAGAFVRGHIPGAASAQPLTPERQDVIASRIPRTHPVVLIDGDGSESPPVEESLAGRGLYANHLLGGMAGWPGETECSAHAPAIPAGDLWDVIRGGEDFTLLDVREPHEFSEFGIPGAVNVPLSELFDGDTAGLVPGGGRVVAVCSHWNRSMAAAPALAGRGIESSSLEGGMAGWNQVLAPTAAVRDGGLTTTQVEKVGKGCPSYILGSGGKAAIDPAHPAPECVRMAEGLGLEIDCVADTYLHADRVSAAAELAGLAGAKLYPGGAERYSADADMVPAGDSIPFDGARLDILHTPGHAAGSMTYMAAGRHAFCGGMLPAGGVGRPDLRDHSSELAGELYDTLRGTILALPEDIVVYPAHGGPDSGPNHDGTYSATPRIAGGTALLSGGRREFVDAVAGTVQPKPMNYETIIRINAGTAAVPQGQIPDLEMGPNRYSVRL